MCIASVLYRRFSRKRVLSLVHYVEYWYVLKNVRNILKIESTIICDSKFTTVPVHSEVIQQHWSNTTNNYRQRHSTITYHLSLLHRRVPGHFAVKLFSWTQTELNWLYLNYCRNMFLGNLSTAHERKARKGGGAMKVRNKWGINKIAWWE